MQIIPLNLDSVLLLLHNSKLAYSKEYFILNEAIRANLYPHKVAAILE